MSNRFILAALASALAVASPSMASAVEAVTYSGAITATFTDPVLTGIVIDTNGNPVVFDDTGGPNSDGTAVYTGMGTNSITWGAYPGETTPPPYSTLTFTGKSFSNVAIGQLFDIGTLTYTNGTSLTGTGIFGATLSLDAGNPNITGFSTPSTFIATENTGLSLARDADFVSFGALPGVTFNVYEGYTATAELYGELINDPQISFDTLTLTSGGGFIGNGVGGVPEPGTWAMLLIGACGVGAALRSRRRRPVAA